jgi:hypothetical protein
MSLWRNNDATYKSNFPDLAAIGIAELLRFRSRFLDLKKDVINLYTFFLNAGI